MAGLQNQQVEDESDVNERLEESLMASVLGGNVNEEVEESPLRSMIGDLEDRFR